MFCRKPLGSLDVTLSHISGGFCCCLSQSSTLAHTIPHRPPLLDSGSLRTRESQSAHARKLGAGSKGVLATAAELSKLFRFTGL